MVLGRLRLGCRQFHCCGFRCCGGSMFVVLLLVSVTASQTSVVLYLAGPPSAGAGAAEGSAGRLTEAVSCVSEASSSPKGLRPRASPKDFNDSASGLTEGCVLLSTLRRSSSNCMSIPISSARKSDVCSSSGVVQVPSQLPEMSSLKVTSLMSSRAPSWNQVVAAKLLMSRATRHGRIAVTCSATWWASAVVTR